MKKFTVEMNGNDPPQAFEISVPDGDVPLFQLIPSMYRLFDQILAVELTKYPIVCHKGCSQCCRQLVPISIPEVFHLNGFVQSLSKKRRTRIETKLATVLRRMETAGIINQQKHPVNYRTIDRDYSGLELSCPFVEAGCCSIYEHRPFACREYYVISEPQNCVDPYQNEPDKVKIKRNMGALMAAFTGRLYGIPPLPIPMVLFQSWADENKVLGTPKWPGIWLFEKIMDCLIGLNDDELGISYHS